MAKKTCKCKEGAPEWMTTFADMVTLLLCFFVLIVSFSEIKKDDQYQAVVEEIRKAFGMRGGGGKLPTDDDPALSLIERLEAIRMQQERIPNRSNVKDPGQVGRESRVTTVREGTQYAIGGGVQFEPDSDELTPDGMDGLVSLIANNNLAGSKNKIHITGHAAAMELMMPGGERSGDLMDLSYRRAQAVYRYMTGPDIPDEYRLEPDRFRVSGSGASEPINARTYTSGEARVNRRVEIIVTEDVVEDFQDGPPPGAVVP
ncbi:MAG: flagellar motor protein MotB [Phycisphaerales bacterium JB063]